MYDAVITSPAEHIPAERERKRLDRPIKNRIVTAILALAPDPRPPGYLKVKGEERLWRVRAGDWRIGYEVDDSRGAVTVIRIGHRSEFYD